MRTILAATFSLALATDLPAALVYSGVQNIAIPDTFDGVYLDFDDYTDPSSFTTNPTVPVSWDINPFFGGSAIGNSDTLQPVTVAATVNSDILNLPLSTLISAASTYPASFSGSTGHIGSDPDQWDNGETGNIGFRLLDSSFTTGPGYTIYGYLEVTLQDDGSAGNIVGWYWDPTGDPVLIPEPATPILLMMAAIGVFRRRRSPAPPHPRPQARS